MKIKQIFHTHSILYFAIYVSITLNGVIRKAINDEPYTRFLNEKDYELLSPCQSELKEGRSIETEHSNTNEVMLIRR